MPSTELVVEVIDSSQYLVIEDPQHIFVESGIQGPPGAVDTQFIKGSEVISAPTHLVVDSDYMLFANTLDNGVTFILPSSPKNGQTFAFKKVHPNNVMAVSGNTKYIDGSVSISFTDVYSYVAVTWSGQLGRWYRHNS